MKKPHLLAILLIVLCISCSEEEDARLFSNTDYFPLEVDNSWTYENQFNQNSISTQGSETITVEEVIQNRYSFSQSINNLAGIFTSILATGEVSKRSGNQRILYDGELSLALEDGLPILFIPLENVVLYDAGRSQNDLLSSSSGEFRQEINGFPIDFNFEVSSIHNGFTTEQAVNGVNYEDVYISKIEVSLSASVFLVFSNFTILQRQNISSITNYYAKDIGLILSEVNTEIIFEDIPEQLGVEIPDVDFTSAQRLENFTIAPNS